MEVIAVTGTTCSGKTEVLKIIKQIGYPVIELDQITNDIYENNQEWLAYIKNTFPGLLVAGTINKKKVRTIFVNNSNFKKIYEQKLWFFIKKKLQNKLKKINSLKVFVEIIYPFDPFWKKLFNAAIFIDSLDDLKIKRLIDRDSFSFFAAQKWILMQMSILKIKNKCNIVIENNGSISELSNKVKKILKE